MKTIIALFMMMTAPASIAQISKCFDQSGKVVGYGRECPAGTRAEQSGVKSAPAAAGSPGAADATKTQSKSLAERDADFRKRQMETQEGEAKAEKKSAEAEQRRRACDDSQAYLKNLQAGQRIGRTDPKSGERTFLNDAEYPKEIAGAQRAIAANCK